MAFHDTRLPVDVERGALGGPGFKTTVTPLGSGKEQRNIDWARTRAEFDIGYGLMDQDSVLLEATIDSLLSFFYTREGKAHTFRFKDWSDFKIGDWENSTTDNQSVATGGTSITLTASTISFTATDTIADSGNDLEKFLAADYIEISGSASNNGTFLISTTSAGTITVPSGIVNEGAGASVTITLLRESDLIFKRYSDGGIDYDRPITHLVSGRVVVLKDNVVQTESTHYTISLTTGLITWTAGNWPAVGVDIQVAIEFDIPMRFDTDKLKLNLLMFRRGSWQNIPLVEEKQ